jgi:hypothetical protein
MSRLAAKDLLEEWAPHGIDTTVPHSARVYDYWLGGKDNYAVDRALGDKYEQAIPTIKIMAWENRKFLSRLVRYMVREAGITQFLDIGTGLPTSPNVHEVAQQIAPHARVVYVDNDPIVLVHARALLTSGEFGYTGYVDADLREPDEILSDPALRNSLDLDRPVGLLMIAILMLLADADDPWGKTRTLIDALPSGSHLGITHPGLDFDPEAMTAVADAAAQGGITLVPRTRADVERFFTGLDLVEPGVVPVKAWRPDDGRPANPGDAYYWAGVARKS